MELQEIKSFEGKEVPISKTSKDNKYSSSCHRVGNGFSSSPQKDEIKIKIKCEKVVEHHTESNRCVQAAEFCNNDGPSFGQIGIDADTDPEQAVKDIEIDEPDTAISATLPEGSSFTDDGEEATIKDKSCSNVSRLSTSKVSPSWKKNDLKIKIKCGKIVQSSIDEVDRVSMESKKDSSGVWNSNKPSHEWKKKNDESKCGMPRVEQDSTHLGLLPPFKINSSLSVSVGRGEKAKSPTLRGSSFQEETDKVLTDGHCGIESNIDKTKISQTKRKPLKSIQPKVSAKRQNKMPKRKTQKSFGSKLNRTLLLVRRTCRKCLKKSSSFSMNINHEKLEHPHICQICTDNLFSFIDKKDLKDHKEIVHSVDAFEVASQKNSDSKTFEKVHMTENFDDNAVKIAKIPKVLERKSSSPKAMTEVDVPLRNNNDTRSNNTFKQNMIKDDLSSKQTEQEDNKTVKPKKQVDLNKNETLPDDGKMKIIPLNNLIETGTYLVTKPTINENGTSWKMEKIEECAKGARNHLETNQLHYEVPVTLSEGAAAVMNAGPTETVFNVSSVNSQTQTTNHTSSIPAAVAMVNPRVTSPSVKIETSCSATIPKSVAIGMPGVNMSNPVQEGIAGVMRGNMRAGMMQPSMKGNIRNGMMQPSMRGNLTTGMMKPSMGGNLTARMMQPTMRGGRGVRMGGGSAVPLIRGMRPRMPVGRGVVGMQGIRPLGISGAPLRPLGVRRAHLGPSGVRGAPLKPSSVPRKESRPQLLLRGNGGVGMFRVPGAPEGMRPQIKRKSGAPLGARPLGVQMWPRVTQPGYRKQIPAQSVFMQPMVPDETANNPTAFQPKIVKVETITLNDEESTPSASVNNVLDRLCGISVTRIKTSTIPKSLEIPPGISLTPASMSFNLQSGRNGFSSDDVSKSSYSITPVLKDTPK